MKKLYSLLLEASLYTVLITLFLCLFSALSDIEGAAISVTQFLLVFAFSAILSLAQLIPPAMAQRPVCGRLTHYAVLTVSFVLLAILTKKIAAKGAHILLAVLLFTAVYAAFVGIAYGIRKAAADKKKQTAKRK